MYFILDDLREIIPTINVLIHMPRNNLKGSFKVRVSMLFTAPHTNSD